MLCWGEFKVHLECRSETDPSSLSTVVASPATAAPDYFYAWTRDGAFAGKLIVDYYLQSRNNRSNDDDGWEMNGPHSICSSAISGCDHMGASKLTRPLRILVEDWILSEFFHQLSSTRSPFGQGEPKFFVDGSLFTGARYTSAIRSLPADILSIFFCVRTMGPTSS